MGYQVQPQITETKIYAWLPKKTTSGKWLWFKNYWRISHCLSGPFGITKHMHEILNEREYLIYMMKHKNLTPKPPFGKSAVYYYGKF